MNVHDELSDNEVLRTASKSLSAIPMASHPDVAAILARGRAHRRHRLSAVAGLPVAAAATALALGLTGALSPAPAPGAIRTVSFTLVSNHNGTATLTINPHELLDAAALQNDLQRYGIPAKVTSGSFCSSDPEPHGGSKAWSAALDVHPRTITFNPAGMPAGTELSIGYFQLSSGMEVDLMLISTTSYTCTSTPPQAPLAEHSLQVMPVQSGSAGT